MALEAWGFRLGVYGVGQLTGSAGGPSLLNPGLAKNPKP